MDIDHFYKNIKLKIMLQEIAIFKLSTKNLILIKSSYN